MSSLLVSNHARSPSHSVPAPLTAWIELRQASQHPQEAAGGEHVGGAVVGGAGLATRLLQLLEELLPPAGVQVGRAQPVVVRCGRLQLLTGRGVVVRVWSRRAGISRNSRGEISMNTECKFGVWEMMLGPVRVVNLSLPNEPRVWTFPSHRMPTSSLKLPWALGTE